MDGRTGRAQADVRRRREREFAILDAITDLGARGLGLAEVLSAMTAPLASRLGVTGGAILLYDGAGGQLRTQFSWGGVERAAARFAAASVEGVEEARTLRSLLSGTDLRRLRRSFATLAEVGNEEQQSYLCVPVRSGDEVLGAAVFLSRGGDAFSEEHFPFFALLGRQVAIAAHNATLSAQARAGLESLQSLSRRVVEAQEEERRHLARELHDEIGQSLTGLKLMLEMSTLSAPESARPALLGAGELVDKLLAQVRTISLDLRPAMLDDLGLLPALLWHFDRYATQTGIHVDFKHMGLDRRFEASVETAAYRIVQEALTNVARHAHVSETIVLAWATPARLCLQIEDRGAGFDQEFSQAAHATSGLVGMRERAYGLGGTFRLESSSEDGTVILAVLPLRTDDTERGAGDADGDLSR